MRIRRVPFRRVRSKTIPLTGGLNEEIANIEMKPGELYSCTNYEEVDGLSYGYRSVTGFERWDGSVSSVEYPSGSGDWSLVRYPSDVLILREQNGVPVDPSTNTEREDYRSTIEPVPGYGPILYVGFYKEVLYAIREGVVGVLGSGYVDLYRMEVGTTAGTGGWVKVTQWPTDVPVNDPYDNPWRTSECQMAYWPTTSPNTESLAFCNGLYECLMLHRDSAGTHTVTKVSDSHLPTTEYPMIPQYFENRLYLFYPEGHVFFSELGKITFDPVFFAGEEFLGWEVTDTVVSPGSAIVCWTEKGIKVFKKVTMSDDGAALSPIVIETFSDRSSSYPMTAQRFLGTMIFSDDRGVTLLDTSEAFGDFKAASISKRVNSTYDINKSNTLGAIVNRHKNQYILFYKSGDGLIFTFDIEKKIKGATYFDTLHAFSYINYGKHETGEECTIAGDNNGYVLFFREKAQSFDGNPIITRFTTAFHNYGSIASKKQFRKILFEISAQRGTQFLIHCDYDYKSINQPKGESQSPLSEGSGGVWATDNWSNFLWSGSVIGLLHTYFAGWGVNMSVAFTTSSSYFDPHTIHNFTTSFSMGAINQ